MLMTSLFLCFIEIFYYSLTQLAGVVDYADCISAVG